MSNEHTLGDQPIENKYHAMMNALADGIDTLLNGPDAKTDKSKTGFCLMMFDFGEGPGRCNYISNAQRPQVIKLLREQLRHFEEQSP